MSPQSQRYNRWAKQPEECSSASPPSPHSGPSTPPAPQRERAEAAPAQSGPSTPRIPQGRPVTRRRKRVQQRNFYQPGIRALMEIRKYQNSTALLIQRLSFARLVREVCTKYSCGRSYLWQSSAITALQEAAEAFLVQLFEDSHLCSLKAKRVTLRAEDIQFTLRIRGDGLG